MNFKESKTFQNLQTAFLRESGAYNEYTFYAGQAKKEGYEEIYNTFTNFAANEQAHAKIWFKLFHAISSTQDNLVDAADLENFERTKLYSQFSTVAEEEGFTDIAFLFSEVAKIEKSHEEVYRELARKLKNCQMLCKQEKVTWQCLNCGHVLVDKCAPETCPVCSHPKGFFKVKEN